MTTEDRTQRIIQRLREVAEGNPDLADFYKFHQKLFELQGAAKADIQATLELEDDDALKSRTQMGMPLLSFAQLPIEADRFAGLGAALAQVLVENDPELEEQTLPADPEGWKTLAEERFGSLQVDPEQLKEQQEVDETEPTLAEMISDLALKPYLQWAADQISPHVDQRRWKRRYCPVCGGSPDFAVLEEDAGARYLVCSRCSSEWLYRRLGCAYCTNSDYSKLFYYPSDDEVHRLYVCNVCRRYVKAIDLRKARHRVPIDAERITTVSMDVAARQEGYT